MCIMSLLRKVRGLGLFKGSTGLRAYNGALISRCCFATYEVRALYKGALGLGSIMVQLYYKCALQSRKKFGVV
jgi:hypothetical protein